MWKPLSRSAKYKLEHCMDSYPNLGFDYREEMLPRNVSRQLFANPATGSVMMEVQRMLFWLVEEVKVLRTRFVFALDQDSKNIR